ncbi:hypothetical protein C0995_016514, partial [Termitomyces sp. Mi166
DNDNGTMNVDSAKQPEETQPVALIKMVTEVKAPASAVVQALVFMPIQFKQNRPSMERW